MDFYNLIERRHCSAVNKQKDWVKIFNSFIFSNYVRFFILKVLIEPNVNICNWI